MRAALTLLMMTVCTVAPVAWSQTAAPQPDAQQTGVIQRTAAQPVTPVAAPAATTSAESERTARSAKSARSGAVHEAPRSSARHSRQQPASGKAGGVLALGATDITGNKELPKVMVIVPWKDSLGATGMIKPTDSLMDEVLGPVDRGVFQRQIRYYGQLNAGQQRPAAGRVAPVGDSH